MAITIILDTINGTGGDIGFSTGTITRGFMAHGLDESLRGEYAIAACQQALVGHGITWKTAHPAGKQFRFSRFQIEPLGAGQFRGQLVYEWLQPAGTITGATGGFLVEDGGTLQQHTTTFMPGTREPIRVGWSAAGANVDKAAAAKFGEAEVPEDYIQMNFLLPIRTLRVTSVQYGAPPADLPDAASYVNKDKWCGRDPGFWLLAEAASRMDRNTGTFVVSAMVYSKNWEDWSHYGTLQHAQTGRYVPVAASGTTDLKKKPYLPQTLYRGNGIVRACPYPWVSFKSLFGFSDRPGQKSNITGWR